MKSYFCGLLAAAFLFLPFPGRTQETGSKTVKTTIHDRVDTRIDNMRYWMEKAEQGLVPYNPDSPPAPAIFKGSRISAAGVKTTNSPDVPVTNLTDVTESENSVFIDPANANYLLNSNNSTSWTGSTIGTLYGANYFQSANAGIAWTGTPNGAGGSNRGDPTTAIGRNGREYVNYISSSSGQGIAYSDDGNNWATATVAPNPGSLADKNHMWIDNKLTSPYEGNLYVAWTDFGGTDDTEIKISRSVNDGVNWSTPVNISSAVNAGSHNQGVNLQTGPAGQVYAVWAIYDSWPSDETALGFAKSLDGGATYSTPTRILSNLKGIRTTGVSKSHRVNSFPSMAVDISGGPNNGNLYVVWTNIGVPGVNTGTNKSVYISRSVDQGATWSVPVRVNQGPNTAGKEAYFPWISCDPETGTLSVIFYDDRNVSSTQCEVFVAYSTDAGNNWTDFAVSDVAFTPQGIPGLASNYMGDYLGITSKGGKVYPCWTDTRNGLFMTYVSPFELGLNAGFTSSATVICTGTAVTFTDLSTGPPTTWTWSFPGGTPSAYVGQTPPPVTYATPGTYDVSLTVTNASGNDTETKTGFITVKNVIAGFSATPTTVVIGNTVSFTDNSACNPTSWQWSFPGGTPGSYAGQSPPPITYSTLGTYDVSLTVTTASGSDALTRTGYITVTPPIFNMSNGTITTCTGNFFDSGGPDNAYLDNEVYIMTFYPSSPNSMMRFNFTSFATESGYDTLTIYNGPSPASPIIGRYHGTTGPGQVTSSHATGALTFRFRSDVSVTGSGWAADISCYSIAIPPVAAFTASNLAPPVGQTVVFTDQSTNIPTSWSWLISPGTVNYVDGTSATSQNPHVQFLAAGPYTVTLTATNAFGSDDEVKTNYINANNCTISQFPWTEGFENGGVIPGCWTQEQVNNSGVNWVFITGNGGSYPSTAHSGTYNACLKDNNSADNKTRLIAPALNLSNLPNPQLKFWHTQAVWLGDQDYLTVFYKTSPEGTWTQLANYTASITTWTQRTLALPGASSTYYIAFEGNARYGYGVCIDDVEVSSSCATLYPVSISIAASANPVPEGTSVTFTATPVNGGTTPAYQWKVNGTNVTGGTNGEYSYVPQDGDQVVCVLTSDLACATGNPATSNTIEMEVESVPPILTLTNVTVNGTQCFDALQTIFVAGSGSSFLVPQGSSATMIAGSNILFYPGTTVAEGGYLLGYIAPGGPWCGSPAKEVQAGAATVEKARPVRNFFRVYPNPTTGSFTLALNGYVPSETVSVRIFNLRGEQVISVPMVNEMKREISLEGFPAGLYMIRAESGTMSGSARIVKVD